MHKKLQFYLKKGTLSVTNEWSRRWCVRLHIDIAAADEIQMTGRSSVAQQQQQSYRVAYSALSLPPSRQ